MNSFSYNGSAVNTAISGISHEIDNFSSLSNEIREATQELISARGFQEYIGGVSSDTFSSVVEESARTIQELVHNIRQKQISILSYSEDKEEIRNFINGLSRKDYQQLDLTELNQYMGVANSASNLFKGVTGTALTAVSGLVEGLGDFVETGADLLDLGKAVIATPFLLGNKDQLQEMWNSTKARVQEKKVENAFNNFYSNTELGQYMKNNAYGFDTVRGISKGLGYTAGIIGLSVVTGGLANGGIGAAGSISAGQLGTTAGVLGFANGTEEAWADGANITDGLKYGVASGAWEGAQWYAGARINQIGGLGDQIASGIFKGAKQGVGVRIGLDTITAGIDAFVRPGLTMVYKDYGGATTLENYQTAFQAAGGWKNVATQAAIGGIASAFSEKIGARKLLKEANKKEAQEAAKVFASEGGTLLAAGEAGDTALRLADTTVETQGYYTDSPFWRKPQDVPYTYKWFDDGSYVPPGVEKTTSRGIFQSFERNLTPNEMRTKLKQNVSKLNPTSYQYFLDATNMLEQEGLPVNMNGLKLIVNHSEGNLGRIKQALALSYGSSVSDETLDRIANQISRDIFKSNERGFIRTISDSFITTLQKEGRDTWDRSGRLLGLSDSNAFLRRAIEDSDLDATITRTRNYFSKYMSADTVREIAMSDGYPATIKKILLKDGSIPEYMIDKLSDGGAATIFKSRNMARMKAISLVEMADFDEALKLTGNSASFFDAQSSLLKAAHTLGGEEQIRKAYYHVIDELVDGGSSLRSATLQARMIDADALTSLGKKSDFLFRSMPDEAHFTMRDALYKYHDDIYDGIDNISKTRTIPNQYMLNKYGTTGAVELKKIVGDFETLLKNQDKKAQVEAALKNYSLSSTTEANNLVLDSFIKMAEDPTNPNKRDAYIFMSKILELNEQGKPLMIINDGAKSGSYHSCGLINLDNCTLDGRDIGTAIHETGHFVFEGSLGAKYPYTFEANRLRALNYMEEPAQKALLQNFTENEREVYYFSKYEGDRRLTRMLQQEGYSSITDYRKALTREYDQINEDYRKFEFQNNVAYRGDVFLNEFQDQFGDMDFKSSEICAIEEINSMRSKVRDAVYRQEFPDYTTISGIIDSTSRGETSIRYGHGSAYFNEKIDPNRYVVHELIADYTNLRITGNNTAINFLRKILGDRFIDGIDSIYQNMLQ